MKRMLFALIFSLTLVLSPAAALATQPTDLPAQVPEKTGDYPDPENPQLRVHVFVHEPKDKNKNDSVITSLPAACSDPTSSAIVPAAGWKLQGNVTYRLNPSSAPSSSLITNLPTIADNGFDTWSAAISGKITFTQGSNTSTNRQAYDGQNIISWGRLQSGALGVTYIRYYTSSGQVVDVDTILNKRYTWSWTDPTTATTCGVANTYDVQDILTHEQGHWMGLDDTYDVSYQNNTMYGYGSTNEIKKDTLTAGDISGVQTIYH